MNLIQVLVQVHAACRSKLPQRCPLGQCKMSILPPIAIHSQDADGTLMTSYLIAVFLRKKKLVVNNSALYRNDMKRNFLCDKEVCF